MRGIKKPDVVDRSSSNASLTGEKVVVPIPTPCAITWPRFRVRTTQTRRDIRFAMGAFLELETLNFKRIYFFRVPSVSQQFDKYTFIPDEYLNFPTAYSYKLDKARGAIA